jgi:hypothetical protein
MKQICKLFFGISFILNIQNVLAQTTTESTFGEPPVRNIPNVLPPTPDAFNFTKYGNLPIGISTGTMQYNLPIYNVQSGSLNHSIGLGYSSNGVLVDEMAPRTGINWTLKAGGAITRTILDQPDDAIGVYPVFFNEPRVFGLWGDADCVPSPSYPYEPICTFDSLVWDFYHYVAHAAEPIHPDYQPDEYTFNVDGYSGKFLKRENGEYTQFTSSGIKIEKQDETFILTVPNGNKYYFGIYEISNHSTEEPSQTLEWIPSPVPTSWLLTKIISPTHDSIVFNYINLAVYPETKITLTNGIAQEFRTGDVSNNVIVAEASTNGHYGCDGGMVQVCIGVAGMSTTVIKTDNSSKYLSSVEFKGGKVDLKYSGRSDVLPEKKLDSIKITRLYDDKLIKCFVLGYEYSQCATSLYDTRFASNYNYSSSHPDLKKRLFLKEFKELSNDLQTESKYLFDYDDINGLPPRLSYSQDRFGSFNGKVNQYFFANDTWYDYHLGFHEFGGDRHYSFPHAKKGMLNKITYPTGGYTEITYEPNKTEGDYNYIYRKDSVVLNVDTSTGYQTFLSSPFVTHHKRLHLKGTCDWATAEPQWMDGDAVLDVEDTYFIDIDIINTSTNVCVASCSGGVMYPGGAMDKDLGFNIPAGTYKIRVTTSRGRMRARIVLQEIAWESDKSEFSGIAGVRVKSLADFSEEAREANRREFLYTSWEDPITPSGATNINYSYGHEEEVSLDIQYGQPQGMSNVSGCGFNTIHSNSVVGISRSEQNTVFYKKVIELNTNATDTKNNGGTEYEFNYQSKLYSKALNPTWTCKFWDPIPLVPTNSPYTNNNFITGTLKSTKTFSYDSKYGNRNIVKELTNEYSVDNTHLIVDTFTVSKFAFKGGPTSFYPTVPHFSFYYVFDYLRYYGFLKLDRTEEKIYESNGQVMTNTTRYEQYSQVNYKPRYIITRSSSGDEQIIRRKYISDVTSSESGYLDYQQMGAKNIIDPVAIEETYLNGYSSDYQKSKQKQTFSNTLGVAAYVPKETLVSINGNSLRSQIIIDAYDDKGNIRQYTSKDGVVTSFVWGYDNQYPVAKITGKSYAEVISGAPTLSLTVLNSLTSTDADKRNELSKIRAIPGCFVSSATYEPLIGKTSEIDERGTIVYYEYDYFNRLTLLRDNDNKILKKICYNYYGQQEDCSPTTNNLANWTNTSNTRCQLLCPDGGSNLAGIREHEEKDINPNSATYNQTRWISDGPGSCDSPPDWQEHQRYCEENINGRKTGYQVIEEEDINPCSLTHHAIRIRKEQNYTDCPPDISICTPACQKPKYSCVSGNCEEGVWSCVKVRRQRDGTWNCSYAYCFSNGTISDYVLTVNNPDPCYITCY